MTAAPIAVREVLGFPLRWLRELPLPSTLLCSFVAGEGGRVVLATAGASAAALGSAPAFVGPEVDALALAAEHDRVTHVELAQWHAWKLADRHWRLDPRTALGGLPGQLPPLGWTTERVLRALGLRLDEVWL